MFEVGKQYKLKSGHTKFNPIITCLFIDGPIGFFKTVNTNHWTGWTIKNQNEFYQYEEYKPPMEKMTTVFMYKTLSGESYLFFINDSKLRPLGKKETTIREGEGL